MSQNYIFSGKFCYQTSGAPMGSSEFPVVATYIHGSFRNGFKLGLVGIPMLRRSIQILFHFFAKFTSSLFAEKSLDLE